MKHLTPCLLALITACSGEISLPSHGGVDGIPGSDPTAPITIVPGDQPPAELPAFAPAALGMRQLLSWQYRNAVRDLLGPEAAAVVKPPADVQINGSAAIGAAQLQLGTDAITAYEESSFLAVQAALAVASRRAALVPCAATGPADDACLGQVIERFGRRAYRRTFTAEEKATWLKVGHDAAAAYASFDRGVEFALAGMLQSPQFLYRAEVGAPNPAHPDWVTLTGFELASRLSFFLAGTLPSEQLLAAAENGALSTPQGVQAAAEALLALPSASDALWQVLSELLQLDELAAVGKDPLAFPQFDAAVLPSMREETRRFIDELAFVRDGDFRGLFTSDAVWVDAKLAALYGVTAPASGFAKVALPPQQPRAGILGQGSFLALKAHPASTSPTLRGKFIRERLLCQSVAAPPPEVNTTLPEAPAGAPPQTMREKIGAHMSSPSCKGCHSLMDPLGLAFESFDGTARYRDTENGHPVDATGSLDTHSFSDARGLGALRGDDPRVARCLARTVYRQAAGHLESAGEARPLAALDTSFATSGYRLKALLLAIAQSDAFTQGLRPAGAP